MKSLKSSSCLDIYALNTLIIKEASRDICEILCTLFNKCINEENFSTIYKHVKVVPIHKSGQKTYNSYRPISIVPVISKIFEKLMFSQINEYFETNHLFSDRQFGFRQNLNTNNAVSDLTTNIIKQIECGKLVCFRSFDMSKAFDTVTHDILLGKMKYYGFNNSALNLIATYLNRRIQYVEYDNDISEGIPVEIGVPQGSCLGPLFFSIFVNDLPNSLAGENRTNFLCADDLRVNVIGESPDQLIKNLENVTEQIKYWCRANKLILNMSKTQNLEISFFSITIKTQ